LRTGAALLLQRATQSWAAPLQCPHQTITGFYAKCFSAQRVSDGHNLEITKWQTIEFEHINCATSPLNSRAAKCFSIYASWSRRSSAAVHGRDSLLADVGYIAIRRDRQVQGDAIRDSRARPRPKGVGGAFPVERPVRICKRSLAKQVLKAEPGDSGHSRVENADSDRFEGERLHLAVANWRCLKRHPLS
jgi:hypothetical protein